MPSPLGVAHPQRVWEPGLRDAGRGGECSGRAGHALAWLVNRSSWDPSVSRCPLWAVSCPGGLPCRRHGCSWQLPCRQQSRTVPAPGPRPAAARRTQVGGAAGRGAERGGAGRTPARREQRCAAARQRLPPPRHHVAAGHGAAAGNAGGDPAQGEGSERAGRHGGCGGGSGAGAGPSITPRYRQFVATSSPTSAEGG